MLTFSNHTYSFLRFFFMLLIAMAIVTTVSSVLSTTNLLRSNKKFKDRLIDRFILASLACLLALVFATVYTISKQNNKAVKAQLSSSLESIARSISEDRDQGTVNTLFQSASLLNADAILYEHLNRVASTAPQIFTQNLLPDRVPWEVAQELLIDGNAETIKAFKLGEQDLLIGYKAIFKEDQITGIIAVPTFLKAPKYNDQLLTTTSLLIGLFVLIFGIFIVAAAVIARQLTSPLEELNEGIETISQGNLDYQLKVKSDDEIGALTQAYNLMLYRLKELQANLVEAERESAWKEMAQQVAHEIKNPLTPMKLSLQHLERQIKNPDVTIEELKVQITKISLSLISQIESLNLIASDFSNFARPIEQDLTPLDLRDILDSVWELFTHEDRIKIDFQSVAKPVMILGAKEELMRVFINLVKNGIEAMPKGGHLGIQIHLNAKDTLVQITDEGVGIDEENQKLVFVPNFSTKTSGTGLGLAITKKIVEAHKGSITFETIPGQYTSFSLRFPLHKK